MLNRHVQAKGFNLMPNFSTVLNIFWACMLIWTQIVMFWYSSRILSETTRSLEYPNIPSKILEAVTPTWYSTLTKTLVSSSKKNGSINKTVTGPKTYKNFEPALRRQEILISVLTLSISLSCEIENSDVATDTKLIPAIRIMCIRKEKVQRSFTNF